MKSIIKKIPLFVVIVLLLILTYPSTVSALTNQTSYTYTSDTQNMNVGNLSFSNLSFKDYSYTTTQAFGLAGKVINTSSNDINYTSRVYYYDKNFNLIAKTENSATAISGTSDFIQMSNLSTLNGHSVNEIARYRLSVDVADTTNASENIDSESFTPSKNFQYNSYDYVIDNYNVDIIVHENNTFDVTETITAYFNIFKHGIFRTIPLQNTVTRLDGTKSTNHARVTNVSVNNEYKASRENNTYKLQIGSESNTMIGKQTYIIKYTYDLGKDPVKNYDELYYNIIGSEWDTVIGNVTFSITMPKNFDSSKLGFSSGTVGLTDNDKIKYNVSENKITGKYEGILGAGEALTVRCELPEGYFVVAEVSAINYIIFLIPSIFLLIAISLWYKFGRDDQVVETVEFYPPQGLNSLEVGLLYKGKANNQDVTSLLIYLANKGYIKICETEKESSYSSSKRFKIIKLKEYDGNNVNEKMFLTGLFTKKQSFMSLFSKKQEKPAAPIKKVSSDDLYDNFYKTMNKILSNINKKENRNKIFEKSATNKKIFVILMIITSYCLITVPPVLKYSEAAILIPALYPLMGVAVGIAVGKAQVNGTSSKSFCILLGAMFGIIMGVIPWAFSVLPILLEETIYFIEYIIGLVCIIGMFICLKNLSKRTPYGNEMLGKIRGFKNFLETAEKERLESMVMQDPTYFYNILPYTYVLGVSDKWIKKFESISLQAPYWYNGINDFDIASFGSFMNSTMTSAQKVMTSRPSSSSSSSGSSSGGGFSGGGSGGGGGGSW